MYNSSIKGQGKNISFRNHIEIPHKVFFNDMSKTYMREEFRDCDMIYSEMSWPYGYQGFNENAGNAPSPFRDYATNINRLIEELGVPAFIICGKNVAHFFPRAERFSISITTSGTQMQGCQLYVWNYSYNGECDTTDRLTTKLSKEFHKPLDFSCGYGQHLLKFDDFIGCDINKDCLTYLSILYQEREHADGCGYGK